MEQTIKPLQVEAEKMIGHVFYQFKGFPSDKDSIFYSLSVGASQDPLKEADFKYTYETHAEFCALPTYSTVFHELPIIPSIVNCPFLPKINPNTILHGEQKLTMFKERIELGSEYEHEAKFIDVIDKGKGTIVWYEVCSYLINDKKRELASINLTSVFIKGLGGFGYKSKNVVPPPPGVPKRNFDQALKVLTYPNQAFLYRLTGDRNPLHIDPKVAQSQHFPQPIIHGMATYGTVAKTIIQELLGNDETRLEEYYSRFVGFVLPGETLILHLWKNGELGYIFEAFTENRKTKVLVGEFKIRGKARL